MADWIDGSCVIPPIDPTTLLERNNRFTPLVLAVQGYCRVPIGEFELAKTAFTLVQHEQERVAFTPVRSVYTNHRCGYIAFFKPSVAEVLAQLPDDLPPECNAYVIHTEDLIECYSEGDGHRVTTVFGIIE